MALRTTRGKLIEMLRNECGISSNSSRGNDQLAYLQQLINRHYQAAVDEFDWPFLRVDDIDASKVLEAGERYYDFPNVQLDFSRTVTAWTFWGNQWTPLIYGIDLTDYNALNPELNQRADPVMKWMNHDERQFEVWPLPASNGELTYTDTGQVTSISGPIVRFTGRKLPEALTGDSSRMDMDDILVVLRAAAEVLAKQSAKDAEAKLAAANARLVVLRRNWADRRVVRFGMGENPTDLRGWPRIRAFPASV